MSGIFGVIDTNAGSGIGQQLSYMGQRMRHRDWFVVDTHCEEDSGVGFGRIGIGIFNRSSQPEIISEQGLIGFLSGELYETHELVNSLRANGCPPRPGSDLNLILCLYQKYGEAFIKQLNGAFFLCIWDQRRGKVLIGGDRFGLYPHYYSNQGGRFILAPEVKGILCDPSFERELDLTALAEYVRFQHLLGEKTFFKDINLFPSGSLLVYDVPGRMHKFWRYWTPDEIPYQPGIEFETAVEEAGRLLRRAVERCSSDKFIPGVYLSGGLDSRTILGLIGKGHIPTLTYGQRNCSDVQLARRIARVVNSDHHWCELPDSEWIKETVNFHLELTEGFHSWIHAHGISTLELARQIMDVNLTGWDGGTVMGHEDSIEPLQTSAVDDEALIARLFYLFNQKYTWPSITEAEEQRLYVDGVGENLRGLAYDSFRNELTGYLDFRPDIRGELFYIFNHCKRLTQNFNTFTKSHIEVRYPFFDVELFDFLYSLPAKVRGHHVLYRAVIARELPRLSHIPYDYDGLLPTSHAFMRKSHAMGVRVKRSINRRVFPFFHEPHTLYVDYERYLQNELQTWARDILLDERVEERSIFNTRYLQSLLDRQRDGREAPMIGKIAPLMTYEMMLRRFYD